MFFPIVGGIAALYCAWKYYCEGETICSKTNGPHEWGEKEKCSRHCKGISLKRCKNCGYGNSEMCDHDGKYYKDKYGFEHRRDDGGSGIDDWDI